MVFKIINTEKALAKLGCSTDDVIGRAGEIRREAGVQPGAIRGRFQFEVVLERVRRVCVCAWDGGDVGRALAVHDGGLPTRGMAGVAVVEARRGEQAGPLRSMTADCQRSAWLTWR